MGYFTKDIAKESKSPAKVSLSDNPNFIEFASINENDDFSSVDVSLKVISEGLEHDPRKKLVEVFIYIQNDGFIIEEDGTYYNSTGFKITEFATNKVHTFLATNDKSKVNEYTYFAGEDISKWTRLSIGKALYECLLNAPFIGEKFNLAFAEDDMDAGIQIISKDSGNNYKFTFQNLDDYPIGETSILMFFDPMDTTPAGEYPSKNISEITIKESASGRTHSLIGTTDILEINDSTFYLDSDLSKTAENIRSCLMNIEFFKSNFKIELPMKDVNGNIVNSDTLRITSLGGGRKYSFSFTKMNSNFIEFKNINEDIYKPVDIKMKVIAEGIKNEAEKKLVDIVFEIKSSGIFYNQPSMPFNFTGFTILEYKTKKEYNFSATNDKSKTNKYTYFVGENMIEWTKTGTATALYECLLNAPFIGEKFNLTFTTYNNNPAIHIISKNSGDDYKFSFHYNYESSSSFNDFFIVMHGDPTDTTPKGMYEKNISTINIKETASGRTHSITGTKDILELNNSTFYLDSDFTKTAENIRSCLMNIEFFRRNFKIELPMESINGKIVNSDTLRIVSLGGGQKYSFSFQKINEEFIEVIGDPSTTYSSDSLLSNADSANIELGIYSDTGIFLGEPDEPTNDLGSFVTSTSKTYIGDPLWFDMSIIAKSRKSFSNAFLNEDSWCDTGTLQDVRFYAKRILKSEYNYENEIFYYSNVLYFLTGYRRNLEENDLKRYIYNAQLNNIIKPLTNQPELFHVYGQSQYFNFILQDSEHNKDIGATNEYDFSIKYTVYTQSNQWIDAVEKHSQNRKEFNMVNTIKLDLDSLIDTYEKAGKIEVYLCRNGIRISEPLMYKILPSCLYKVNDFAFLNSLGGWSSFNFGGTESQEFKASANTIFKPLTPNSNRHSDLESVYNKNITEQFIAQTMPIDKIMCEWLKEFSSSIAVYELKTKRYVIVDEMNIKPNSNDDLFRVEMKYHYSDKYNAILG